MPRNNKTSSVLRLIGVQSEENAGNAKNSVDGDNSGTITNLLNQVDLYKEKNNKTDSKEKINVRKKSRRKTVVKNSSVKKLVGGAVPNPTILNIGIDEPVYRRIGNERQIVNVSALLISEQLGPSLERFNSCFCDICCRIATEKAMAIMPDCFIHVNIKTDENRVNYAIKELRPEAVRILTKLCITARAKPFHDCANNK